jgi:hypothetical protein
MASLTETAVIIRKIIRYGIYFIVFVIVTRYTFMAGNAVYRRLFPKPEISANPCFGQLPPIAFPQTSGYEEITLILETPDGNLPKLTDLANVYFMPRPVPNVQNLDRAKIKANQLEFNQEGRKITDTTYIFESKDRLPTTLTMNIVTENFSISYDIANDPAFVLGTPQIPDRAIENVKSYLTSAGLLPIDLRDGNSTFEFIKAQDGKFVGAISLSEADTIRVNLFRMDYNSLPSLTPDPSSGNTWFIAGPQARGARRIIAGERHYYPIDTTNVCIYPIKNSSTAWDELRGGRGYIANWGENLQTGQIKIRRVYLGYFDSKEYQEFYQPIFVFQGDNNFYAYVPAIIDQFISE